MPSGSTPRRDLHAGALMLEVHVGNLDLRSVDRQDALRPGVTIDGAAAAIFAIGHPETYRALVLVLDGDWDDDAWATWLQATLEAALPATAHAG